MSVLRSITEVDTRYYCITLFTLSNHFMGWEAMRWPFIRHGDGIWPRLFNLRFIDDFPVIWVDFLTWPGPINYLWSDRSHMSGKLVRSPSLHISQDDVNPWYHGHWVILCSDGGDQIAWVLVSFKDFKWGEHMSFVNKTWKLVRLQSQLWVIILMDIMDRH